MAKRRDWKQPINNKGKDNHCDVRNIASFGPDPDNFEYVWNYCDPENKPERV
jgi:hypothetical protein